MQSKIITLVLAILLAQASAHTWVEQMTVIRNGIFSGANGYIRNYISRTDPNWTDDTISTWQIPTDESGRTKILPGDLLCHPSQRKMTQSPNYPRLKASPGDFVALKYLENGHVTQPWNQLGKPQRGGTVFVFGTNEPKVADEKLADVLKWTVNGDGGDKRGRLLGAANFDDLRCHQVNPASPIAAERMSSDPDQETEQWCETDVKIPEDTPANKPLTVYWVWQWPTIPKVDPGLPDGKDEYYSSCADIDVVSDIGAEAKEIQPPNPAEFQDPQTKAAPLWSAREALMINPVNQNYQAYTSGVVPPTTGLNVLEHAKTADGNPPQTTATSNANNTATATASATSSASGGFYTTMVTTVITVTIPYPTGTPKIKRAIDTFAPGAAPAPSHCSEEQEGQSFCHGIEHQGFCKDGLIIWTTLVTGEQCNGKAFHSDSKHVKKHVRPSSAKFGR